MSRKMKLLICGAVLVVLAISSIVVVNMIPVKEYGLYEVKYGRDGIARDPRTNKPITGIVKSYWDSDKKIVQLTAEYRKGKLNGYRKKYFSSGRLSSLTFFKDGEEHGKFESYYEDGALYVQKTFVYGKIDGKEIQFMPDGHTISHCKEYHLGHFIGRCS